MSKAVIAVDVDDVLVESAGEIIAQYNQRWGTKLGYDAFYAMHDDEAWGVDEETAIRRVDEYVLSQKFVDLVPTQAAIEALCALTDQFELHILTGRSDVIAAATRGWLNRYFPNVFTSVNFSNMYNKEKYRSKGEMCAELGAEVLIDDHLDHLISGREYGIKGILFGNYAWNQANELPEGIHRCIDWLSVVEYLHAR